MAVCNGFANSLASLSRGGCLLFEGGLGLGNDAVEGIDVMHNEIGEDLAIHFNVRGFETFNEAAVGKLLGAGASTNTLNPQAAELTLTLFTVAVLVETRFTDGVLGVSVEFGAEAAKSFGTFKNALPTFAAGWAIGCSRHVSIGLERTVVFTPPAVSSIRSRFSFELDCREGCVGAVRDADGLASGSAPGIHGLGKRKICLYGLHICIGNEARLTQIAFPLWALLCKNVAFPLFPA